MSGAEGLILGIALGTMIGGLGMMGWTGYLKAAEQRRKEREGQR